MPVVGSTTLQPGEESTLTIPGHAMEGRHRLQVTVESNDPIEPQKKLYFNFEMMAEQ